VRRFQREGRTIVFVTHAPDLVRRICDRAVVLDHGEMVIDSTPGEAVRVFRETLAAGETVDVAADDEPEVATEESPAAEPTATLRVHITGVDMEYAGRLLDRRYLLPNEALTVRVKFRAEQLTDDLRFGIAIYDENGNHLFGTNTAILGIDVPPAEGDGEITFEFERVPLLDGTYFVTLGIMSVDEGTMYDWREQQCQFEVMNPSRTAGLVSFPIEVRFAKPRTEPGDGAGA
jgi:ABC-type uncharacterized transport system ATPase subunit